MAGLLWGLGTPGLLVTAFSTTGAPLDVGVRGTPGDAGLWAALPTADPEPEMEGSPSPGQQDPQPGLHPGPVPFFQLPSLTDPEVEDNKGIWETALWSLPGQELQS